MTVPRLRRNRFRGDGTVAAPHDSTHHAEDLHDFHLPLIALQQAGLQVAGVLHGLEVRGTPGATQLTIDAGVAVDAAGQLIVLGTDGRGDIGSDPKNGDHDEQEVPVTLPLPDQAGSYCVTVQFNELLRANDGAGGRVEQAPWLQVRPVGAVDADADVVLAVVELAAEGADPTPRLRTLAAAHEGVTAARRVVGRWLGELALAAGSAGTDVVGDSVTGRVRAQPGGGLALTVAGADSAVTLARDDDGRFARMDVRASETRLAGALSVADALITAKSVQVGLNPIAGVTVAPTDTTPNAGFVRFGDGTGWKLHLGRAREGVSGPLNTGLTGVFATIADNGSVGIGTTRPSARLSVTEPDALEIAGAAQSPVLRTSAGPLGAAVGSEVALSSFGLVVDKANNVSLGLRAIRVAAGPPGWPSVALGLGMDVDNTVRAGGTALLLHHDSRVEVRGDVALHGKHALRGNDNWLRLNQDSAFDGVHTPGLFYPGSLAVGTTANPGLNNATIIGALGVGGTATIGGDVALSGKHALRGNDEWLRLNQGGAFVGVHTPGLFHPGSLAVGTATNPGLYNAVIAGALRVDGAATIGGAATLKGGAHIVGDVTITGRIGVAGWPADPHTQGWGGGIRTWDLEVEATTWSRHGVQTGPRDVAENFAADGPLSPGDVVCFHPDRDVVVRSTQANDALVCGVISTTPGFLLNARRDDGPDEPLRPVALAGRVPCKVVAENGPVQRGDLLTTSSIPGHAMKALPVGGASALYASGTILGKALAACDAEVGEIEVFVTAR